MSQTGANRYSGGGYVRGTMGNEAKDILGLSLAEGGEASEEGADPLQSAAEDLIAAVHSKDAGAVADALRNAFTMLESEPHEESPGAEGSEG